MRKLAIGLLALFRRVSLAMRKLRGQSEDDVAAQRVVSGRAWDEFCDTLKAAGASLSFPGAPRDAFNQAEGYRYLSRLIERTARAREPMAQLGKVYERPASPSARTR